MLGYGVVNETNRRNSVITLQVAEHLSEQRKETLRQLAEEGYHLEEHREVCFDTAENHKTQSDGLCYSFDAYSDGAGNARFLTAFPGTGELRLVSEKECRYFEFGHPYEVSEERKQPLLIQTKLSDYGMGYVLRLSCGKFIVIDGGRYIKEDADELLRLLTEYADGEKPVVALWVFSHPHTDHYRTFIALCEQHPGAFTVERFLFNFPEADDLVHYPKLDKGGEKSEVLWLPKLMAQIEATGAAVFTAHTGQIYPVGDAEMEILSCMDDTIHLTDLVNATSLVMLLRIAGQKILLPTDAAASYACLAERYGTYLKADILQAPHHGLTSGKAEAEETFYDLVKAPVVLVPAEDWLVFRDSCLFRPAQRYLMTKGDYREYFTGCENVVLALPYTPTRDMRGEVRQKAAEGEQYCGKRVHFFTDLNSGCPEDLCLTVLNTTVNVKAKLSVDLFFGTRAQAVYCIEGTAPASALTTLHLMNSEEMDPAARVYNPNSLALQGIPENTPFGMRVISDIPVVVTVNGHHSV